MIGGVMRRPPYKPAISGRGVAVLLTMALVSVFLLIILAAKRGPVECPEGSHLKNFGAQSSANRWVCVDNQTGLVTGWPAVAPTSTPGRR